MTRNLIHRFAVPLPPRGKAIRAAARLSAGYGLPAALCGALMGRGTSSTAIRRSPFPRGGRLTGDGVTGLRGTSSVGCADTFPSRGRQKGCAAPHPIRRPQVLPLQGEGKGEQSPKNNKKRDPSLEGSHLVEHRRLELLTPTLPVLCATNCANAPNSGYITITFPLCKAFFYLFVRSSAAGGPVETHGPLEHRVNQPEKHRPGQRADKGCPGRPAK